MYPKELSSEEFRKYAVHHRGLNGLAVDQYMNNVGSRPMHQIDDMTLSPISTFLMDPEFKAFGQDGCR